MPHFGRAQHPGRLQTSHHRTWNFNRAGRKSAMAKAAPKTITRIKRGWPRAESQESVQKPKRPNHHKQCITPPHKAKKVQVITNAKAQMWASMPRESSNRPGRQQQLRGCFANNNIASKYQTQALRPKTSCQNLKQPPHTPLTCAINQHPATSFKT